MCCFWLFFRRKCTFFLAVAGVFLLVGAAFRENVVLLVCVFRCATPEVTDPWPVGVLVRTTHRLGVGADRWDTERKRVWNGGFRKAPRMPARAEGCPAREPAFFTCQLSFLFSLPQ